MKLFRLIIVLLLLSTISFAKIKNGEELIAQMHKKYANKWYQTLTFVQKTTFYNPDGTTRVQTWYEAMQIPGKLRIDFDPLEKGNGIIFNNEMQHNFRDGKLVRSQKTVHPLLVLGFDVYGQSVAKTIGQLQELGMDLSLIHENVWQGRAVYVVGAKQGDVRSPQFWIDKKNLYFVRLIQLAGPDKKNIQETQFNKYQKLKSGGWVSPEVVFLSDGKQILLEEYSDIQANVSLDGKLFEPESWMSVERKYFRKK